MSADNPYAAPAMAEPPPAPADTGPRRLAVLAVRLYAVTYFINFLSALSDIPGYLTRRQAADATAYDASALGWGEVRCALHLVTCILLLRQAGTLVDWLHPRSLPIRTDPAGADPGIDAVMVVLVRVFALCYIVSILNECTLAYHYVPPMLSGDPTITQREDFIGYAIRMVLRALTVVAFYRLAPVIPLVSAALRFGRKA